jgi:DNA (cytosine-5)-methyltransferase 1
MSLQMVNPTVISTFAGCGGSSLGYKYAGFKELLAIDFDKNSVETFALNFPDVPVWKRDINEVTAEEILSFCNIQKGELDVFDGSPPCQGFSTAGKRNVNDSRNDLFKQYCRLLKDLQPKVFIMENVSGMIKGEMKGIFIEVIQTLKACGYNVKCKLMNAMWYDVPQSRERLIFIGVRNDFDVEISFPKPKNEITTIAKVFNGYQGTYEAPLTNVSKEYWPKLKYGESASKYHPKGHLFGMVKLDPSKPSPTLLKSCGNPICHHLQPRFLDQIELKRIASFPDSFKFIGGIGNIRDRLGNSVCPLFMKAIAMHVKEEILSKTL